MKIIAYYVASSMRDIGVLSAMVSKAIDEGWVPLGGVSVSRTGGDDVDLFCQAMVKYEA